MIETRATARPNRAERREASRALRSQRLLGAALLHFAQRGYHDTSVDEIVAEARTSKSTFYEFFATKEDCFRELLRHEGGSLMQQVIHEATRGHHHRERLRLGIATFVGSCAERRPLARLLLVESVGISAGIEAVRHDLLGRFAAVVEQEVMRACDHDDFYRRVDPIVFGRALVGAVNEATSHFLSQAGAEPEAVVAGLCEIFAPADS